MLDMVSLPQVVLPKTFAYTSLDKPDETLESDAKYAPGQNPMLGDKSKANK